MQVLHLGLTPFVMNEALRTEILRRRECATERCLYESQFWQAIW